VVAVALLGRQFQVAGGDVERVPQVVADDARKPVEALVLPGEFGLLPPEFLLADDPFEGGRRVATEQLREAAVGLVEGVGVGGGDECDAVVAERDDEFAPHRRRLVVRPLDGLVVVVVSGVARFERRPGEAVGAQVRRGADDVLDAVGPGDGFEHLVAFAVNVDRGVGERQDVSERLGRHLRDGRHGVGAHQFPRRPVEVAQGSLAVHPVGDVAPDAGEDRLAGRRVGECPASELVGPRAVGGDQLQFPPVGARLDGCPEALVDALAFVRREQVGHVRREQVRDGPTGHRRQRLVGVDDGSVGVEDVEGVVDGVECVGQERSVDGVVGADAAVARDVDVPTVALGREFDAGTERVAALAATGEAVRRRPRLVGAFEQSIRRIRVVVERPEGVAQNVAGSVPGQAGRAVVPTGDTARGVEREDGVRLDGVDEGVESLALLAQGVEFRLGRRAVLYQADERPVAAVGEDVARQDSLAVGAFVHRLPGPVARFDDGREDVVADPVGVPLGIQ
jgi:hypothetical protein